MTDLSNPQVYQASALGQIADSFGTWLHFASLIVQATWRKGDRSRELELIDGTYVPVPELFGNDGTTLCVPRPDGPPRRIPASQVLRVVDKGDYGYV